MADMIANGGLTPVYNVGNNNDDVFGSGNGLLVFFLFFLLAWGGFGNNGFGPNGVNGAVANYATQADITNGFNYANINSQLGDIQNSINTLGYNQLQGLNGVNTNIMGGFANLNNGLLQATNGINMNMVQTGNAITNGIANLGYATQNQICGVNNNIDNVKYQLATEACATRAESDANTQRILDRLTTMQMSDKDNQIAALQSNLLEARNQIDNANQTQAIVNALKPYPVPAYNVSSPYASNGCGCTLS